MEKNYSKSIIRTQKNKENPYVMIDKTFLSDDRLSWKAKGLLAYFLSKPDDWRILVADLIKKSTDGEKSIRSGLKELQMFGYLENTPVKDTNGRILYWEKVIYETPKSLEKTPVSQKGKVEDIPDSHFVHVENLHVEKEGLLINDLTNNDLTNKNDDDNIKNERNFSENIFEKAFQKEALNQQMPKDEIQSISEVISKENIQFNLIVLKKTIELVMKEYKNTNKNISSFKSYFLSALKNNQNRFDHVRQIQEIQEKIQEPLIDFEFYNWLEEPMS